MRFSGSTRAWFIGLAASVLRSLKRFALKTAPPARCTGCPEAYYELLTDKAFIGYRATGRAGHGGMFAIFVGSPFVSIELFPCSPDRFGFFFGANAVASESRIAGKHPAHTRLDR